MTRGEITICKWCKNPDGHHENCEEAFEMGGNFHGYLVGYDAGKKVGFEFGLRQGREELLAEIKKDITASGIVAIPLTEDISKAVFKAKEEHE